MENKENTKKKTKSKFPEVRMTKTAQMRLLKANPMIKIQMEKTKNQELMKNLNLENVSTLKKAILENSVLNISKKTTVCKTFQAPKPKTDLSSQNHSKMKRTKEIVNNKMRRSTSAPRLQQKRCDTNLTDNSNISTISNSLENIPGPSTSSTVFKNTPNRKYSVFTHVSSHRKSLICSSPSAPVDLKKRLSDWLSKKNKNPKSFKHLKCFGVHKIDVVNEEDKENINTSFVEDKGSYEDLRIVPDENILKIDDTSFVVAPSYLKTVAKAALTDLHCLMEDGYPKEQCEDWLTVIRNKCPDVVEDPQYWECKAIIEQLRGDIGSAVECYKTAVVHGAEVSSIEQSLNHLLEKFKVLEIDTTNENSNKDRTKVIKDFTNVFTSMIIKFAISEKKNLKKKEESSSSKLFVTPVRRSTRLNRSGYISTPGVKICSSLQEISEEMKEKMTFKPNVAL